MKCQECGGSGEVYEEHDVGATEILGCQACEGTGVTPEALDLLKRLDEFLGDRRAE